MNGCRYDHYYYFYYFYYNDYYCRYDHYCAWLDQSIGAANHRPFLGFVTSLLFMSSFGSSSLAQHAHRGNWRWQLLLHNQS